MSPEKPDTLFQIKLAELDFDIIRLLNNTIITEDKNQARRVSGRLIPT